MTAVRSRIPTAVLLGTFLAVPAAAPLGGEESVVRLKTKLFSHDTRQHDCFGRSLAINGDLLIAGAKGDDERGNNSGAAYIFKRVGEAWVEQAKLKASDATTNDFFGFSVGISGDTAIVGAWQQDEKGNGAGAAYVFRQHEGQWAQEAKLTARDGRPFAEFGYAVAIEGDTAVIGARQDSERGDASGAAYVFRRDGLKWTQEAKLSARDTRPADQFGGAVALDADVAVIGASGHDSAGTDAGAAYVFRKSAEGWKLESKLTANNAMPQDAFGYSVAIDRDTVVAGAYRSDTADVDAGSLYVFARQDGGWHQAQQLTPYDAIPSEWFGWSVGLHDGTLVVGAWYDTHGSDKEGPFGSAYVFKCRDGRWQHERKLVANKGNPFDLFGWAVAVGARTVGIGARLDDEAALEGGAVYVDTF